MELTIKFTRAEINYATYYLRRRYKSKAGLEKLAKLAILTEMASEAKKELDEINKRV